MKSRSGALPLIWELQKGKGGGRRCGVQVLCSIDEIFSRRRQQARGGAKGKAKKKKKKGGRKKKKKKREKRKKKKKKKKYFQTRKEPWHSVERFESLHARYRRKTIYAHNRLPGLPDGRRRGLLGTRRGGRHIGKKKNLVLNVCWGNSHLGTQYRENFQKCEEGKTGARRGASFLRS